MVFVELGNGGFKLQGLAGYLQPLHEIRGSAEQNAESILDERTADR